MVFNRFSLYVLIRVFLLVATIVGLSTIFLRPDLFFTQIILSTVIVVQILELTNFVNRTNRDLSRFLAAVRDGDFSINFSSDEKLKSFKSLNNSFRELIETLKELETEKEAQLHFLNQLVNQIEFGIITFNEKQELELINAQALSFLEIPKVRNWKKLNNPNFRFLHTLLELSDTRNQLIENKVGTQTRFFSVSSTSITIREQRFKIVSFQDIKSEIQQKEIEAWHKLIRILTHEIMNSVTPLVSLTETITMILADDKGVPKKLDSFEQDNIIDVHEAVNTIKWRSEGILKFVQDYRKLTRIPKPEFELQDILSTVSSVEKLMKQQAIENDITISVSVSQYEMSFDSHLIQQVLINLLKNAIEALQDIQKGKIEITSSERSEHFVVTISDNGPGVPPEKLERIFVPFYTTKSDGSGVGLSVCRQIMNLHGGFLEVTSEPGETNFMLVFPATPRL